MKERDIYFDYYTWRTYTVRNYYLTDATRLLHTLRFTMPDPPVYIDDHWSHELLLVNETKNLKTGMVEWYKEYRVQPSYAITWFGVTDDRFKRWYWLRTRLNATEVNA